MEIVILLERLNHEGMTILMITYDPHFGKHAELTMHLKDSRILREEMGNV
jgi:ABC-type lipoprotein export system ATPase subunit